MEGGWGGGGSLGLIEEVSRYFLDGGRVKGFWGVIYYFFVCVLEFL